MVFDIYKPGQGKYTRLCSAVAGAVIVGLGCMQLYKKLEATELSMWAETLIPVASFVVLGGLAFWLVNKPSVADFMISAEGEVKKVSWSSRQEVAVSTFIVIFVVIILAIILGITDLIFSVFFQWLLEYGGAG